MIKNGPARTFTRNAVEAWLFRLSDCDWERFIDKQHLQMGRSFYREGVLSSLDIQSTQIIVTQKIDRVETYSVIEWNEKKPEIRTSSLDDCIGIGLGTAGLYEIEELVAEIHQEDPLLEQLSVTEIEPQKVKIEELDDKTLANERFKFETKWNFFNNIRTGITISVSVLLLILLTIR